MKTEHPITPPPELVREWTRYRGFETPEVLWHTIATQAARWGADQQLKMDANWVTLQMSNQMSAERLITEMRPKPPSLKEQALGALENLNGECLLEGFECPEKVAIIRRALDALPE